MVSLKVDDGGITIDDKNHYHRVEDINDDQDDEDAHYRQEIFETFQAFDIDCLDVITFDDLYTIYLTYHVVDENINSNTNTTSDKSIAPLSTTKIVPRSIDEFRNRKEVQQVIQEIQSNNNNNDDQQQQQQSVGKLYFTFEQVMKIFSKVRATFFYAT